MLLFIGISCIVFGIFLIIRGYNKPIDVGEINKTEKAKAVEEQKPPP